MAEKAKDRCRVCRQLLVYYKYRLANNRVRSKAVHLGDAVPVEWELYDPASGTARKLRQKLEAKCSIKEDDTSANTGIVMESAGGDSPQNQSEADPVTGAIDDSEVKEVLTAQEPSDDPAMSPGDDGIDHNTRLYTGKRNVSDGTYQTMDRDSVTTLNSIPYDASVSFEEFIGGAVCGLDDEESCSTGGVNND